MNKNEFKIHRCRSEGVEAVEADTRHVFPRHSHEQYGIGVIHRGAQRSHSGRGTVEAGAGDTITVNPGEVHDGAPIGEGGRSWRMLYFSPTVIRDAVGDRNEGRARLCEFPRPVITDAVIACRFQRLFVAMTTGSENASALHRDELLQLLLAGLTKTGAALDDPQPVSVSIGRARSLIDDDPSSAVTLAGLARECGLSKFQIVRGFVRATGLTPHAYLVQRRSEFARRLIARGVPLAEVAAGSGFSDQSHMTRVFVRRYGFSPGAYAGAKT